MGKSIREALSEHIFGAAMAVLNELSVVKESVGHVCDGRNYPVSFQGPEPLPF
jgi:hypothetical protein